MATFNYPNHEVEEEWPENSARMSFGRGYQFASAPKGPAQVIYRLHFTGMKFYMNTNMGTINRTTNPTINIAHMKDFYKVHQLYTPFVYPHPEEGDVNCRFNKPFTYKIMKGGLGAVEPFTLEFILLP